MDSPSEILRQAFRRLIFSRDGASWKCHSELAIELRADPDATEGLSVREAVSRLTLRRRALRSTRRKTIELSTCFLMSSPSVELISLGPAACHPGYMNAIENLWRRLARVPRLFGGVGRLPPEKAPL